MVIRISNIIKAFVCLYYWCHKQLIIIPINILVNEG